ncbi:methionine adenosyltransferase [Candidatus Woesearchaeota archaeon]|nr:MAG: methionine adenosyltransferase [Candidatus Woesearchaeota archaeon]
MVRTVFSSESVTEGHPDKLCDKVSDAVLDEALRQDPDSRVACETATKTGAVINLGEITTNGYIDFQSVVRKTVVDIGYVGNTFGFDGETCAVINMISSQSPDISQGVTEGMGEFKEQGAGDQGMMFGLATNETANYMPMPIDLAHKLTLRLAEVRKSGLLSYLGPDGKSQVAVVYDGNPFKKGKVVGLKNVVISSQHLDEVDMQQLRNDIKEYVIDPVCKDLYLLETKFFINPTGRFVYGGPVADAGLTGRKIIVDTYGGFGRHGGGAFSGKDPSKVDRSAAYAARYAAKNLVAAGLADMAEVQLAYAIGVAEPTSVFVETFGTGKLDQEKLEKVVRDHFPVKPKDIIDTLQLKNPKGWSYCDTAAYGHFGRDKFPWEKLDKVEELQKYL